MQDLKTVNADDTGIQAFGVNYVNSYQQVVGIYNQHGTTTRAFVYSYQYSAMCDLTGRLDSGSSSWTVLDARAINSDGVIVGEGTSPGTGSNPHALRLKVHGTGPSGPLFGGRNAPDSLLPPDAVSAPDQAAPAAPVAAADLAAPSAAPGEVCRVWARPMGRLALAWWEWDGGDLG